MVNGIILQSQKKNPFKKLLSMCKTSSKQLVNIQRKREFHSKVNMKIKNLKNNSTETSLLPRESLMTIKN